MQRVILAALSEGLGLASAPKARRGCVETRWLQGNIESNAQRAVHGLGGGSPALLTKRWKMSRTVRRHSTVALAIWMALGVLVPIGAWGALVPPAHPLFEGDAVHEIHLTFSQPDWWDQLVENFEGQEDPSYLEAAFDWEDVHLDTIGVRFKGSSSYTYPGVKKSFKLDIDVFVPGQEVYGLDKLNLNNCFLDPSFVRERSCYELCQAAGLPTERTNYAELYINGTYWGLYLLVEQFDQEFIESRFGAEEEGNLWKGDEHGTLEYLGTDESLYYGEYELKTNEDQDDWSALVEMVDAINNTAIGSLQDTLHPIMDVNSAMAMLAIDNLTVNLDSYPGRCVNYYFYHRDLDSRFVFAQWDLNESWGIFNQYNMSLTQLKQLSPYWTNPQPGEDRPLAEQLWQVSDYDDIYLGHMKKLMATAAEPTTLLARMEELRDLVRSSVYADTNKMFSNSEFEAAMTTDIQDGHRLIPGLNSFINDRDAWLQGQIGTWTPIEGLVINELMAKNDSTIADGYGDYDDWIEVANVGASPIDLTGLGLVDHMDGSGAFTFPATTLNPGEYILVWADEEPEQGSLHAPFKLDADGEDVYLFDGAVIIDQVTFPDLAADLSFGRYPNGTGDWGFMAPATPGATNGPHNTPPEITGTAHAPTAPTAAETVWVTSTATDDGTVSGVVLTYDAGSGPVDVTMCDDGAHSDGDAGDGVYGGQIPAFSQDTEVDYYVTASDSLAAQTTDPQGAPADTYTYIVGYAAPPIYINEFMADNDGVIQDGAGDYDDWFELYNGGGTPLELGGMYLTDDLTDPTQWQISAGTTIPAGGYLVFWADDEESEGSTHTNFKLGKSGEQIGLFDTDANGNVAIDTLTFGQQSTDVSMGRFPDGADCWRFYMIATPEASNVSPHMPHDAEPDGDVDLDDYAEFSSCLTGPGGAAAAGCEVFDADCDGDVDLTDFASLQAAFNGP